MSEQPTKKKRKKNDDSELSEDLGPGLGFPGIPIRKRAIASMSVHLRRDDTQNTTNLL